MKKIRFFLAAVLCMSMMAFVGCGADNKDAGDTGDGTVKEETVDRNYDKERKDGDSITEDMADGAKDAVDDVEDVMDGSDSTKETKDSATDKK